MSANVGVHNVVCSNGSVSHKARRRKARTNICKESKRRSIPLSRILATTNGTGAHTKMFQFAKAAIKGDLYLINQAINTENLKVI